MTRDILPQVGTILDNMAATLGAYTLTFTYLPWGPHWDRANYARDRGLLSARTITHPRRIADIGGGASRGIQSVEIHAWFENHANITNLDSFKKNVRSAIETLIRTNEKSFTDAFYVFVENDNDPSALVGPASSTLVNELVLLISGRNVEVYA